MTAPKPKTWLDLAVEFLGGNPKQMELDHKAFESRLALFAKAEGVALPDAQKLKGYAEKLAELHKTTTDASAKLLIENAQKFTSAFVNNDYSKESFKASNQALIGMEGHPEPAYDKLRNIIQGIHAEVTPLRQWRNEVLTAANQKLALLGPAAAHASDAGRHEKAKAIELELEGRRNTLIADFLKEHGNDLPKAEDILAINPEMVSGFEANIKTLTDAIKDREGKLAKAEAEHKQLWEKELESLKGNLEAVVKNYHDMVAENAYVGLFKKLRETGNEAHISLMPKMVAELYKDQVVPDKAATPLLHEHFLKSIGKSLVRDQPEAEEITRIIKPTQLTGWTEIENHLAATKIEHRSEVMEHLRNRVGQLEKSIRESMSISVRDLENILSDYHHKVFGEESKDYTGYDMPDNLNKFIRQLRKDIFAVAKDKDGAAVAIRGLEEGQWITGGVGALMAVGSGLAATSPNNRRGSWAEAEEERSPTQKQQEQNRKIAFGAVALVGLGVVADSLMKGPLTRWVAKMYNQHGR